MAHGSNMAHGPRCSSHCFLIVLSFGPARVPNTASLPSRWVGRPVFQSSTKLFYEMALQKCHHFFLKPITKGCNVKAPGAFCGAPGNIPIHCHRQLIVALGLWPSSKMASFEWDALGALASKGPESHDFWPSLRNITGVPKRILSKHQTDGIEMKTLYMMCV